MKLTKRKGFNFFRSYYDVYNELNDKDKVAFIDALFDRQFLGIKPNDLKGMAKFAYISQTNSIDSQVRGYEDKTGIKLHPTVGVNEKDITPTLQVQGQEKVQEKGEYIKGFSFRKSLLDLGLDSSLVNDFLKNRKLKRLANTETAFNKLIIELNKNDKPLSELMEHIVSSGWGSFKNSWEIEEKNTPKKEILTASQALQKAVYGDNKI